MKRIVVLGNSIAGVRAIEKIREKEKDCTCTIISFDKYYPYNRLSIGQLIGRGQKTETLYYKKKDFYEKHNIQVLLDQNITRINLTRKKIHTEEKLQIDFDILLICDLPGDTWPDIKGTNKNNIFSVNKLKSVNDMVDAMAIFETIVIESDRVEGFALAMSFLKQKKDVTLVTKNEYLLKPWLTQEAALALTEKLKERGLTIAAGTEISEILGEGDAKAVRLKNNKVLASEITLFADAPADTKLLGDSSLTMDVGIVVDERFRTNIPDVYALDAVCRQSGRSHALPKAVAALEAEGENVAAAVSGGDFSQASDIAQLPIECDGGLDIQWIGALEPWGITETKSTFDPSTCIYKGLYCQDSKAQATLLINASDRKDLFTRVIRGEIPLDQIGEEFAQQLLSS